MNNATYRVRSIVPSDLARVIELDQAITGLSRRGFYEKRFRAFQARPDAFVSLGIEQDGRLVGDLFAHVQDGEFGGARRIGVLDAFGVEAAARGAGMARALLAALDQHLVALGIRELQTQADWSEQALIRFFASAGFLLAPTLDLALEIDFLRPVDEDAEEVARDFIGVRALREQDLSAIVAVDRRITGRDRLPYYQVKLKEMLEESGVRMSLVAELEGRVVGFIMARVDFGEFGRAAPVAVMDTIGVHPDFAGKQVGRALLSQLLLNLASLRVERLQTQVQWDGFELLRFLKAAGFQPSQRLSFRRALPA